MYTKVLIAGDYCPNNRIVFCDNFLKDNVFSEIKTLIAGTSFSLINLECPVMNNSHNYRLLLKQGPHLVGSITIFDILSSFGFKGITLANNHICDYGDKGIIDTIEYASANGINYVGAGAYLQEALQVLYKNIGSYTVAFINCCEHEFSIATKERAGANPLDITSQFYQIIEAKQKSDYVIVIVHGGVEHFQYPTTRMVKTYRFFIDAGADAVINHHQHCPCGYEEYKGKPIFYGLGNFFFPWNGKENSIWNLGYMVRLVLGNNRKVGYEIIPYRQCDGNLDITLLKGDELKEFNSMMDELCVTIQDETKLEEKLHEFNHSNDFLYKKMFEPYSGRLMNGLYRRGLLPSFMSKERILAMKDFLECESHYERVKEYIDRIYNSYNNE